MARDKIHDVVRIALENDGWTIIEDPLILIPSGSRIEIDLAADKILIAEKQTERIAVEVKSFSQPSVIYSFHSAIGQYMNYLIALEQSDENRVLYLAIERSVYLVFQQNSIIKEALKRYNVKLILLDIANEKIVQWIN